MLPNLESFVLRVCNAHGKTIGTGFVVSDGLAITCAHVVKGCGAAPGDRVRVVFYTDGATHEHEAEVLRDYWRETEDIAVLRIEGEMPRGVSPALLGRTSGTQGHPCSTLGYPELGALVGTDGHGTIYSLRRESSGRQLLQLTSKEITVGFSGAPLLDDETGRVVGMVTQIANPDGYGRLGETAFATSAEVLYETLRPLCPDLRLHPPQAVEDYLDAVRDYCASLPYLTLHDIRPPRTLDQVYVPLKARPLPRKTDQPERDDERIMREAIRSEPLSVVEVMREKTAPHVLILGEPGAGKSTLLRQLAERAWDAPEQIGLDQPYLPILAPLRRLAGGDGSVEKRLNRALTGEMTLRQDLPDGFLDRWPNQTGAYWLILLDALDEVPEAERAQLMQWLKALINSIGQNRLAITSRPSGYAAGELRETLFGHYDLLPFTLEQTGEFARKWFRDKANDFLKELERIRAGELRGTPLLLTIAAKVYGERSALPERRSALYGQFVDIWLKEAERRGLLAELGERICKVARFALARLALAMTEQPDRISEAMLSQAAAAYLRDALHLSDDEAEADGRKFVEVVARRSGVFIRHGDAYDFVHPTFREYLAALAVVRECNYNPEQAWQQAISRWQDYNWREVALFALSILSDADKDVTKWVRRIRRSGKAGLYFAAMSLADQVKVEANLADAIIDDLIREARGLAVFGLSWQPNPLSTLSELRGWARAADGLLALARDERVEVMVRDEAASALGRLGQVDDLLALARNERVEAGVRVQVAKALGELGRVDEAALILLALARDEQVEAGERVDAAEALGRLGRVDEAVPILLALARDARVMARERRYAAEALGQLGRVDEAAQAWLALARDERVVARVRTEAVAGLSRLGRVDELLALARDAQVNSRMRHEATATLGELGRVDELLALARDAQVKAEVRREAAGALGRLGRVDEAVSILLALALARDERVEWKVRHAAADALGELGRVDEAAQAWLALARDERVWWAARVEAAHALGELGQVDELLALARDERVAAWMRVKAAHALGELGQVDDAVPILLALARDTRVEASKRRYATEALGVYGDMRLLPELDHIAQTDANQDVRKAARVAIERIRGRLAR